MVEPDVFELPLFPLHTVLFPRMDLPLKIFEPRYRQMLQFCMEHDRRFGVVLIRSGQEVGGPAEPYGIGTIAAIQGVQPQADGTIAVATEGTRRFHLLEVTQRQPYQVGLVEYVTDPGSAPGDPLVDSARELSTRCLRLTLALSGEWVRGTRLPEDPEDLSYVLAARLARGPRTKQRLLEARTAQERLNMLVPLFQEEEERLRRQIQDRNWFTSINLN